jgi:cysteine desulfurase
MLPFYAEAFGHPDSRDHAYGWDAAEAVETARAEAAELVGARAPDVLFAASATEAIALAFDAFAAAVRRDGSGVIASAAEHRSVHDACARLEARGVRVDRVRVDGGGLLDLEALERKIAETRPRLVCAMLGNNEIGTLDDVARVARIAHAHGALVLSDVTQAAGKIAVDLEALGVDLAVFASHKMCGPKGAAALVARDRDVRGRVRRGGTPDVPALVGFGEACRLARLLRDEESGRVASLRDRLETALAAELPDVFFNGRAAPRLPNTTSAGFPGVDARALIRAARDVAVSTRSACTSSSAAPSHVLKAIGLRDADAFACVRFSLGRFTTEGDVSCAVERLGSAYRRTLPASA